MEKILILGYGNVDRQDDGVAWHILERISQRLGRPTSPDLGADFPSTGEPPELLFFLQLAPEIAETLAEYEAVCFVDAHTGAILEDVQVEPVSPAFQASPFTHHMTPQTCLSLAESLYGRSPQALLVSVRGHQFGFSQELSEGTSRLAYQAVEAILRWLKTVRQAPE